MMTENPNTNPVDPKHIPFGMRLQSAREALGLESKDAAAQLRLNERVILMMEKDTYSSDLPPTFMRGYLRSYGKLLQIPEHEINHALEPIQPKPAPQPVTPSTKPTPLLTSGNYFMQLFTYLIILTLVSLVGLWWYTHPTSTPAPVVENQLNIPAELATPPIALQVPVKADAVAASVNLGAKLTESNNQPATAVTPPAVTKNKPPVTKPTNERDSNADDTDTDTNDIETNSDTAD